MPVSVPRRAAGSAASTMVMLAALAVVAPPPAARAATWPPSTDLLISEVATAGATASDEFVELYNAGGAVRELGGCELVYVTASGSGVTRKASFAEPMPLAPGQHLVIANSAGTYAAAADSTYAGGLAGDGGSVALRRSDGTVLDALSWGTAQNTFAEGAAAPAPPAGSSLERRPGPPAGNPVDTNDNAADWFVQPAPNPQPLGSAQQLPSPGATAMPSSGDSRGAEPPTSPEPSASLESSASPEPSADPTSPLPSATANDAVLGVADARAQPVGSRVRVRGDVTALPASLGSTVLFAIGDAGGGIFIHPSAAVSAEIGRNVEVEGTLAAPYGQLEIRDLASLSLGPADAPPGAVPVTAAEIGEVLEGRLVSLEGTVTSVRTEDGRLSIEVADAGATVRVLADPTTGLTRSDVWLGERIRVSGVVGQHASASGALDGYKLWLRFPQDLVALSAAPTASGSGTGQVSGPRPTASPVVYGDLVSGLAVRGRLVDVAATVTAGIGLVEWGGPTIVVDDGTAAVAVVLPATSSPPHAGDRVRVMGKSGSYDGGPRIVATLVAEIGAGQALGPAPLSRAPGGAEEWRLVSVTGRIERLTRAGSRWRADLDVAGHSVAVLGEPAAGISSAGLTKGRLMWVAGIVRRSLSDKDVFYVLPRNRADVRLGAPVATPRQARPSGPIAQAAPAESLTPISELGGYEGRRVTVAGLVTGTGPGTALLDDGTGTVRLGGEDAAEVLSLLEPGDAVEVAGTVARDEIGLLILVDPEHVLSVAGPDPADDEAETGGDKAAVSGGSPPGSGAAAAATPDGQAQAGALALNSGGRGFTDGLGPFLALGLPALLGLAVLAAAALASSKGRRPRGCDGRGRALQALDAVRNTLRHA